MKMPLSKRFVILVVFCFCLTSFTLSACHNTYFEGNNNTDSQAEARTITDLNGDQVELPSDFSRIICRSGNGTSFIVGMGLGDKLVGTADYVVTNPWVDTIYNGTSKLPCFEWAPAAEAIYEVDADLVMLADGEYASTLRDLGITALCYKQYNEEEMIASAEFMDELLGDASGDYISRWLDYYHTTMDFICDKLKNISEGDKPTIYYIYGQSNKGLTRTSGGGSIYDTWASQSGGVLATNKYDSGTTKINEEEAIALNPTVIMIGGIYQHSLSDELMASEAWNQVEAVKNNRVYTIPVGFLPWDMYGVEYPLWVLWTAKQLYPELIDSDMHEETRAFYKEFYGVSLTDEQVTRMLDGLAPDGSAFVTK